VSYNELNYLLFFISWNEAPRSKLRGIKEAPRSKLRGIKAKLRRSQPVFALEGFDAVRPAIHPCSKLQGILAKANK